ncbi:uncharacterized protein LOC125502365 [Dendroctonus ponderosae]|nr:uncharacterized protein LOC125502365 [Dendroctonus ponderosae]
MTKSQYTVVQGERAEVKRREDQLKVGSGKMETLTTSKQTFESSPSKTPERTVVDTRRHMQSHFSLGDDKSHTMQTTNQSNYNTYTKKVSDKKVMENVEKRTSNVVEKKVVSNEDLVVKKGGKHETNVTTTDGLATSTQTRTGDVKTLSDGTIVKTTRTVTRHTGQAMNEIRKSSSQTHVQQSESHVEKRSQNNIIQSASSQTNLVEKRDQGSHHRKSTVSSEEINNQILHRKGMHTSTEALHATSASALDMRKSVCNIQDQGRTVVNTDRHSLSSMHRSHQEASSNANRRSLQSSSTVYQTIERPQKIVRKDNLAIGGHFYGKSEANSYGEFTKQQNVQKVERVTRRSNVSNITLGDSNVHVVTSYKKEYAPRNIGPCPAVLVDAPKGPFKHTRDTKSHKFYMPIVTK